jgi:hypothetical protein
MRALRLSALVLACLACTVVAASCVQGSASPPEADPGAVSAPGTLGPEPIAEDREPFGSKAFPFVVDVPDDGKDPAGGWQKTTTRLHFVLLHEDLPTRAWWCPRAVGMPSRCAREGRITPSYAAFLSAEIATEASKALLAGWEGPEGLFCFRFTEKMQQLFKDQHPGIGAKVTRL